MKAHKCPKGKIPGPTLKIAPFLELLKLIRIILHFMKANGIWDKGMRKVNKCGQMDLFMKGFS